MAKKILIVEDHADMMHILTRYLSEHNYTVIGAETAEIGLKKFKKEKPDLILMDLMLPGISGLDAVRKIKKQQSHEAYIPIIIITAKNLTTDIVEGLNSGADDYIVKPFHFDEMLARIESALRLKDLNELLVRQTDKLENANTQISDLNQSLVQKNKELRKNIYDLHSLFEVSMDLNSILELPRLVNSFLLTMVGQFGAKNALFLFAPKPEIDRLQVLNSKGFYLDQVSDLKITKNDPLFNYLKKRSLPTIVRKISKQVKNSAALKILSSIGIELVGLVQIKGVPEGLVCLGPRVKNKEYRKQDLEQISILSNIISIAVANASLYQEVEQLSYTDGMTELHNFRYFELRLKEEIVRHKRTKGGLSLLILDVDNFKNFNDTMGHPAGDEVLRKISFLLKESVRENDIVARYGGEEFAVIIPAVDKEGARILAERIREKIDETYFEHEEVQPLSKVTVSVGVSSMQDDIESYQELLNSADNALYAAKHAGRNQVKCFQKA